VATHHKLDQAQQNVRDDALALGNAKQHPNNLIAISA
jgi:hypothetical protein